MLFALLAAIRNIATAVFEHADGGMDWGAYLMSTRFLTFGLAIIVLGVLGVIGVFLKKKAFIKALVVITLAYNTFIFVTT